MPPLPVTVRSGIERYSPKMPPGLRARVIRAQNTATEYRLLSAAQWRRSTDLSSRFAFGTKLVLPAGHSRTVRKSTATLCSLSEDLNL
jgi:hypothetical protein